MSDESDGSWTERAGVRYLHWLEVGDLPAAVDAIHVLNAEERAGLAAIERSAIVRAVIAGTLSSVACALPLVLWEPVPDGSPWTEHAARWAVVGGVTGLASAVEIAYLYAVGLRAVRDLAHTAGMDLSRDDAATRGMVWALMRAALELPNPPGALPGFDPLREASRLRVVVASALYKLKVAATGFVAKAVVQRVLGRAATRSVLAFVSVPVTAAWDGVLTWDIVREARIRVMGPSAAREFTEYALAGTSLSAAGAECAVRAVGAAMVRTEDPHPNLLALLAAVRSAVGVGEVAGLDESSRFLTLLGSVSAEEQSRVLRLLAAATIIDGRLVRAERRLLREAFASVQRAVDERAIDGLRATFVAGDPIDPTRIAAIA